VAIDAPREWKQIDTRRAALDRPASPARRFVIADPAAPAVGLLAMSIFAFGAALAIIDLGRIARVFTGCRRRAAWARRAAVYERTR
jgi:hypothetical protein